MGVARFEAVTYSLTVSPRIGIQSLFVSLGAIIDLIKTLVSIQASFACRCIRSQKSTGRFENNESNPHVIPCDPGIPPPRNLKYGIIDLFLCRA